MSMTVNLERNVLQIKFERNVLQIKFERNVLSIGFERNVFSKEPGSQAQCALDKAPTSYDSAIKS